MYIKKSSRLVSVIITLGTNISGGYIVFYDGVNKRELGKRSHVLIIYMAEKLCIHLKDVYMNIIFGEDKEN